MRLAAFQAIIYLTIATASSLKTYLACNHFIFYIAAMTESSISAKLIAHETLAYNFYAKPVQYARKAGK